MGATETGIEPIDFIVNIGSMIPVYGIAVGSEVINTSVDVINSIVGTDFDLSFEHNHPN
ncbi:MAG: hypothetical protein WC149_12295 [Arcobacteraceae bacterium]